MTRPAKNVAASIRQRLMNTARESGRPFQEVLEYYAMERFLYRLACSPHASRFVLKGALMFRAWGGAATRPTRDIDLLGRVENTVEAVVPIFREVCGADVEPDGMVFAVSKTFANRKTPVVPNAPALTAAFATVPGKEGQWKGFVRKAKLLDAPGDLTMVVTELGVFCLPMAQALAAGADFHLTWRAPGPWA